MSPGDIAKSRKMIFLRTAIMEPRHERGCESTFNRMEEMLEV